MATTFPVMEDITSADAQNIKLYQQAIENGDFNFAAQYYSLISNADKKIVNAAFINAITAAVNSLEDYAGQTYVVSATQPTNQIVGDWWFQIV